MPPDLLRRLAKRQGNESRGQKQEQTFNLEQSIKQFQRIYLKELRQF